jgi:organic hydroperoxide reductase OsmC/OhrA
MANTREHRYTVSLTWTGNLGSGTLGYRDYSRDYEIGAEGKPVIRGSADPAFWGDRSRWNPEELLLASLSACHKLWYLHLAAEAGIIVTAHADRAEAVLEAGPVQECGAAPDRDRGSGQRRRPGANSPPTRAREVLHCQLSKFSCRVRAGDRLGRLSGGHRGDESRQSGEREPAPGMEKRSRDPLRRRGSRTAARPSSVERGPNFGPKRPNTRRN